MTVRNTRLDTQKVVHPISTTCSDTCGLEQAVQAVLDFRNWRINSNGDLETAGPYEITKVLSTNSEDSYYKTLGRILVYLQVIKLDITCDSDSPRRFIVNKVAAAARNLADKINRSWDDSSEMSKFGKWSACAFYAKAEDTSNSPDDYFAVEACNSHSFWLYVNAQKDELAWVSGCIY